MRCWAAWVWGSESRRAQADLAEGLGQDRLAHGPDERRQLLVAQAEAFLDGGAVLVGEVLGDGDPRLLVAEGGLQQGAEEAVGGGVEATDDAPVEDADPAVAEHQQVAGVDVAVEVAEPHGRHEERPDHLVDERHRVVAERRDAREVVDGHAVEQLHRQDVGAREQRIGLGHGHEREVGEAEQPPVVVHGPGLVAQVELFADLLLEPLEQLQHLGEREVAGLAGDDRQERAEEGEVGGDGVLDAGPQDLHRDLATVDGDRPVDHGDRRPPDRVPLELGERPLQRHADVVLDLLAHLGPGGLRAGVERVAELAGHGVAEHPGRRRHELAELHERGAEVLERAAQRTGPRVRWQVDAADLA